MTDIPTPNLKTSAAQYGVILDSVKTATSRESGLMLTELFYLDRRLALANERLATTQVQYHQIHDLINRYLTDYAHHNDLSIEKVLSAYDEFSRLYSKHLDQFRHTGLYPSQAGEVIQIDRITYDIALILSCVLSPCRFGILSSLLAYCQQQALGRVAVIGTGAGLELEILRLQANSTPVTAFDLSFNSFLCERFPAYTLTQALFGEEDLHNRFDTILAIELLEHLSAPDELMQKVSRALHPGGVCLLTTATDMPQFDHHYNFTHLKDFQQRLQQLGFVTQEQKEFVQDYPLYALQGKNHWFVLKKV